MNDIVPISYLSHMHDYTVTVDAKDDDRPATLGKKIATYTGWSLTPTQKERLQKITYAAISALVMIASVFALLAYHHPLIILAAGAGIIFGAYFLYQNVYQAYKPWDIDSESTRKKIHHRFSQLDNDLIKCIGEARKLPTINRNDITHITFSDIVDYDLFQRMGPDNDERKDLYARARRLHDIHQKVEGEHAEMVSRVEEQYNENIAASVKKRDDSLDPLIRAEQTLLTKRGQNQRDAQSRERTREHRERNRISEGKQRDGFDTAHDIWDTLSVASSTWDTMTIEQKLSEIKSKQQAFHEVFEREIIPAQHTRDNEREAAELEFARVKEHIQDLWKKAISA
ncbi:hypothetical protein JYU14_01515 [Simkania negevensis]|uniref:Uncharacterized protein n=1 Tax=Simkania negevensis TaxID=83561 RepID=A0ABS3ARI9_9BACT|nr:hypothetical protein [Simkania negevensis]